MAGKKNILIGGAWPYANNHLHLGHISGLISGDVLARYHRIKGDNVFYVSGTDCHGTPITETAKKQEVTPRDISEKFHKEFSETFKLMNFSYDLYTKTDDEFHKEEVKKMFLKLKDNGYIYENIEPQPFCENCNTFLEDRELKLKCSKCGLEAYGDQCDCGHTPTSAELEDSICAECGYKTLQKSNKNLFFALTKFQNIIEDYLNNRKEFWRKNAVNETEKYLKEGLRDRAITRNLTWGVDIPLIGYEDKRLYVWIDAVWGYITGTKHVKKNNWEEYWKSKHNPQIYMVHGKDNIVFHTIILPALMLAQNENFQLPTNIVSNEFLNINDEKISKSKGNAYFIKEAITKYSSDSIRYYLIKNLPEKKDGNFSIKDFELTYNSDINNKFSNFVNRTLNFKGLNRLKYSDCDESMINKIKATYLDIENKFENLEFREALNTIFNLVSEANLYYDNTKPWIQRNENPDKFNKIMFTCATIIANLSNMLEPIMPNSYKKLREYLNIEKATWSLITFNKDVVLNNVEPLFARLAK
jgi:methionyl-tRNA synthetase